MSDALCITEPAQSEQPEVLFSEKEVASIIMLGNIRLQTKLALLLNYGKVSHAARDLKIKEGALRRRMSRFKMRVRDYKPKAQKKGIGEILMEVLRENN